MGKWAAHVNCTSLGENGCSFFFNVRDEEDFYEQSLCSHVAVINYLYTFALIMQRLLFFFFFKAVCCENPRPQRDQHPVCPPPLPDNPSLIKAGCNWCESRGLIIPGLDTTLQQNLSPLVSGWLLTVWMNRCSTSASQFFHQGLLIDFFF